jgi:hypothetical protein
MKLIIRNISATILSFIVMFSSMSFAIDEHFCGSRLMDVSYFGDADNCGMDEIDMSSNISVFKKNNCCKDQITLLQSSIFNKEKLINLHNTDIEISLLETSCYSVFYKNNSLKLKYYKDFSPPDITKDIRVLHQTFLI